jgi:hypothetical protein
MIGGKLAVGYRDWRSDTTSEACSGSSPPYALSKRSIAVAPMHRCTDAPRVHPPFVTSPKILRVRSSKVPHIA